MPALAAHGTFLTFSVPDLDASLRWYSDKLGLRMVHVYPRNRAVHARAVLMQGGGLLLELVEEEGAVDLAPQRRHGLAKAGLVLSNFEQALATLRARGVHFVSAYARRPDQPANATIEDNAGNRIVLFEGFSAFDDPLIGLVQVDEPESAGDMPSCFEGRVVGSSRNSGDTVTASRGVSNVTVAVYTKSPGGGAMGDVLASAHSDGSGDWKLPHKGEGVASLIIAFAPPAASEYRGTFTTCATHGGPSLSMVLPRR